MRRWTEEEKLAIAAALADVDQQSQHSTPESLEGLAELWKSFVREVEQGYSMSIYDYTNDLSIRDILDDVLTRVPLGVQQELKAELESWDDRYRLATKPAVVPILPGPDVVQNPRWWRIPRVLTGELRDDFVSEGIIADTL
ncbi:MAG TPA: hypothetical protein VNA69_21430 [Thermoanaerobaculia bacterium]|nr:hypothetical protein [Thermoanaerobaculia bacterium]